MAVIRMGKNQTDVIFIIISITCDPPTGLVSSLPATPEELGKEAFVALCKVILSEICFLSFCKYFCRALQGARIFKAIVCCARKYFLSRSPILYCCAKQFYFVVLHTAVSMSI